MPELQRGDNIYIAAFWELSSERFFGQVLGPIPWSKIRLYGHDLGLNPAMMKVFHLVLREMDEAYQQYQRNQQSRNTTK